MHDFTEENVYIYIVMISNLTIQIKQQNLTWPFCSVFVIYQKFKMFDQGKEGQSQIHVPHLQM